MSDDILFDEIGRWGVVTLNRPSALNALNLPMVAAFHEKLLAWETAPHVAAVMVKGAGGKAFCAGGDIRVIYENARTDPEGVAAFFREEYKNNVAIHRFPKPFVAMIDGIVMGGGVGVSVHGDFRVVGDRTMFAMPETGIGLFPDVGGGYFMPRLHDGLGLYYALTGARAKAADCMAAGVGTHYAPGDDMAALEKDLMEASLGGHPHADIEAVLDAHAGDPGHAAVNDRRDQIKAHFENPASLQSLLDSLAADGGQFATETLETLNRMSPTSMAITFEQMRRGHGLDFEDVMRMEFRIVRRILEGHDFFEGVRAQIIDKDRNPTWSPAALRDVAAGDVDKYFEPLGAAELELS
ncbi:MAG: enoyl-CoA hydratase/isomerase family protein [Parvularculaceae bacterium]